MAHTNPNQPPFEGATWTGFEWVTPERYEQLVAAGTIARPASAPTGAAQAGGGYTGTGDPMFAAHIAARGVPVPDIDPDDVEAVQNFQEMQERPSVRDGYPDRMRLEECFAQILEVVDPDPERGGLDETPTRAAKAWLEWTSGYSVDIKSLLKVFEDGAQGCDEMVVVKDIPIHSHCEHHLAAIFGTATIGYLPNGKIVGLSKLNRLADAFARRLQVQERMTNQIAEALMEHLAPLGCGVVIKARHMCMESRGVCQQGTVTFTSALRGVFREDPAVRAEFLALARE